MKTVVKRELKRAIGKDLYLMAAGMLTMQTILFMTKGHYVLMPTLIAGILLVSGSILRQEHPSTRSESGTADGRR